MHFKHRMAEFAYSLELWRSHMKKIEGHFGTGVTSYFLFLKWLFLLNIPVFTLTLGFVVVPQILYRYNIKVPSGYGFSVNETSVSFTGEELLTGGVSLIHWISCTKFKVNGPAGWHKSWQKKQLKHTKLRIYFFYHFLELVQQHRVVLWILHGPGYWDSSEFYNELQHEVCLPVHLWWLLHPLPHYTGHQVNTNNTPNSSGYDKRSWIISVSWHIV